MRYLATLATIATSLILQQHVAQATMPVYVSGYTDNGGQGIYKYDFNDVTGELTDGSLVAAANAPSYFIIKQNTQTLYAVSEVGDYEGTNGGSVIAFQRNPDDGSLTEINQEANYGASPCYAETDGAYVYTANYMGGSISSLPILPSGGVGALAYLANHTSPPSGGVPDRQEAAHAHSFDFVDENWAVSCDLGTDETIVYKKMDNGKLEQTSVFKFPNGTGPRHVAISQSRETVYVMTELYSQVYVLHFDREEGKLSEIEHHNAVPEGEVNGGAEIELSPDGRFLYASVRFVNLITIFAVDHGTGKLKVVDYLSSGGDHPRQFKIDPSGHFMLVGNQNSNNIVIFKINQSTGLLEDGVAIDHPQPTCIKFWT
ncbi:6-phosphogluconolactonase [Zychaea mexicana]|uniref:6-phosphogluconolactonase n=1 Tax=Zychaea mexicana TaxID=64656 RepID=UPI0022FDFA0B|nr:6-phosphogluconolactonase [Zychaea mexicana]KAI9499189.1 6-phosphogluconolactonase [Zychaea mexicana]